MRRGAQGQPDAAACLNELAVTVASTNSLYPYFPESDTKTTASRWTGDGHVQTRSAPRLFPWRTGRAPRRCDSIRVGVIYQYESTRSMANRRNVARPTVFGASAHQSLGCSRAFSPDAVGLAAVPEDRPPNGVQVR